MTANIEGLKNRFIKADENISKNLKDIELLVKEIRDYPTNNIKDRRAETLALFSDIYEIRDALNNLHEDIEMEIDKLTT